MEENIENKTRKNPIVKEAIEVEHFIVRFINHMKKNVLSWSLALNLVLISLILYGILSYIPTTIKECTVKGADYCWVAVGNIFDKYFQSTIPLKIYTDGYWKMRYWLNEETKDKYKIETMTPNEKNSEKVKAMTNSLTMLQMENIKLIYQPIYPSNYRHVSSLYGYRNMNKYDKVYHPGVDFPMEIGNNIFAMDNGIVILSKFYRDYGSCIMIQHPYNIISVYGHLSRRLVRLGDKVQRGEIIALSGNTGESTGPHLHFELRYGNKIDLDNDTSFNPLLILS
jgi:hypothetical protein